MTGVALTPSLCIISIDPEKYVVFIKKKNRGCKKVYMYFIYLTCHNRIVKCLCKKESDLISGST